MPFSAAMSLGDLRSAVAEGVSLMTGNREKFNGLLALRGLCGRWGGAASVLCEIFHKVGFRREFADFQGHLDA